MQKRTSVAITLRPLDFALQNTMELKRSQGLMSAKQTQTTRRMFGSLGLSKKYLMRSEVHGVFNIPMLASDDKEKAFVIYDGKFEALSQPPKGAHDRTRFLVKNQGDS